MPHPNYGRTARDYALHRAPLPEALFDRLAERGLGRAGQRVLDLGTGTGVTARAFARRGCDVVGLDVAPDLLEEARALDAKAGVSVTYRTGVAEGIGLEANAFDVVTASVCWHWFDGRRAAAEARRVIRPGGHLVIIHFDWLPGPGTLVEDTERIIWKHVGPKRWKNKLLHRAKRFLAAIGPGFDRLADTGIHPGRLQLLAAAGYAGLESFSFDCDVPYSHEAWRGRVRSHADVGASQSAARVARVDADLHALLRDRYAAEPLLVPHRVFVVIGQVP